MSGRSLQTQRRETSVGSTSPSFSLFLDCIKLSYLRQSHNDVGTHSGKVLRTEDVGDTRDTLLNEIRDLN